jgi:hypothetical protein
MNKGLFSILEKVSAPQAQPQHQDFLDEHFSISPNWKEFKNKLRSKTFVEAVNQDTRSDDKLKRFSTEIGRHVQARGVPNFQIPSASKAGSYLVKYHADTERFSCNCGDWTYARSHRLQRSQKDCKHIKQVKYDMAKNGQTEEDLVKKAALCRAALKLKGDH